MNSTLDTVSLKFKNSLLNNTATITATTSILDFSNNSTIRQPILQISPCNISFKTDSQGNLYMGSCYDSTTATVPLYNQTGSLSTFSLPISNQKDLFLLKMNKYGFITNTATVGIAGTTAAIQVTSLAIDNGNNVYFTGLYRGSISVRSFGSTAQVIAGPTVSTDTSFIVKYTSAGTATSWAYLPIGLVTTSVFDSLNYYYAAGSYSGSMAAYNFESSNNAILTLPNTGATQSSFILKYLGSNLNGFTVIGNSSGTLVTTNSMVADNTGSVYVGGSMTANAVAYTYNFTGSSSLGIQQLLGSNTGNNSFIVKYDKFGTLTGLSLNTGTLNSMFIDSSNNLYSTGSYDNTNTATNINNITTGTTSSVLSLPISTVSSNAYIIRFTPTASILTATAMTVLKGPSYGQSLTATNSNIYWSGQYNSSISTISINDFTTTGSLTTSFYLPTTSTQENNTFLIKYNTVTNTTSTIAPTATGYQTLTSSSTSNNLVTDSSNLVYLGSSITNSNSLPINDFSSTVAVTNRYTMTSAVSNTAFFIKYTNGSLTYNYNPAITNMAEPITNQTTTSSTSISTASTKTTLTSTSTKQYRESIETIKVSGSAISTTPTVISVINPSQVNNQTAADTSIVPNPQIYSNYSGIPTMFDGQSDETGLSVTVDNTNEFIYVGGTYNTTNPVAVYNRDGSYSGFSIPRVNLTATSDIYIVKFNFTGQALSWVPIVGLAEADTISTSSMTVDKNGFFYVAGAFGSSTASIYNFSTNNTTGSVSFTVPTVANLSAFILVYGSNGTASRWTRLDNGTLGKNEIFNSITTDSNGNLYATGQMFCSNTVNVYNFSSTSALASTPFSIPATSATSTANSMVLIKWSSLGIATGFSRLLGPQTASTSAGLSVVCDSTNNVYCAGYYTGSSAIYDFSGTNALGSTTFSLQNAPTENAFIVKWSSAGLALSATTLNSTNPNRALSLSMDRQDNLYCSGFYSNTAAVVNFAGTTTGTVIPFILQAPTTINAFAIKWSNLGIPTSFMVLPTNITSSGLCIQSDSNYNVYLSGFYNSTSAVNVYNFSSTTGSLTSAFTLPLTSTQDAFIIKYNMTNGIGLATGYSTLQDTGPGSGQCLVIDKYDAVHYTGSYISTTIVNSLPVYNISSNPVVSRFSFDVNTSASAAFYIKYTPDGLADIGQYLTQFIVNIPTPPAGTSSFKKSIILKGLGYSYVIISSTKSYVINVTKIGRTLVLLWSNSGSGSSWSIQK